MTNDPREGWVPWRAVLASELEVPAARDEWDRTALARAVANRIVSYRVEHGLSQTALAKKLGMRQPAISRLELGETNPSLDTLIRLADVLDLEFLVDVAPEARRSRLLGAELRRAELVERVVSKGARVTVATT